MLLHAAIHGLMYLIFNCGLLLCIMQCIYGTFYLSDNRLLTLELISGSHIQDYSHLQQFHVWGCATFRPLIARWEEIFTIHFGGACGSITEYSRSKAGNTNPELQ